MLLPHHLAPFAFMILTSDSGFENGSGGMPPTTQEGHCGIILGPSSPECQLMLPLKARAAKSPAIPDMISSMSVWEWGGPVLLLGLEKNQNQKSSFPKMYSKRGV